MLFSSDEVAKNPANPIEQGTAADVLQAASLQQAHFQQQHARETARQVQAAVPQKLRQARVQSLYLGGTGNGADGGMPWLAPYFGQHSSQNEEDNHKWGSAFDEGEEPYENKVDPLWCGAASCTEHR
jgi:hypothetical protein